MSSLHVLVVEDHDDSREVLAELLQMLGASVCVAANVEDALGLVDAATPDLILSDLGLPEVDGFELSRRLSAHPNRKAMRLVAVTGFSDPADHRRALQAGYDAV